MRGKLKQVKGNLVTFELDETLDLMNLERVNGVIMADIEFIDTTMISHDQRKHWWALMGDYEWYTGTPMEPASDWFKYKFMLNHDLDEFPSLAMNAMTKGVASQLLEETITWFIHNDVPFRKQQWYLSMDASKMLYALTMKRICWVTGKPSSDIHHATNLVGMGRNRQTHSHIDSTFMCLSREAHIEIHTIGLSEFCEKYHVKPIKLNERDLKKIGVS